MHNALADVRDSFEAKIPSLIGQNSKQVQACESFGSTEG